MVTKPRGASRPRTTRPPPPAVRLLRTLLVAFLIVGLGGGGFFGARWLVHSRSLAWQVDQGFELLAGATTSRQVTAAIDLWEQQTRPLWADRTAELIDYLCNSERLADTRARLLLARVCGADYGDRLDDWRRWHAAQRQLRAAHPLTVPRTEAVHLQRRWQAPVGMTTWFTTILPLDGKIYVASLGAAYNDPEDASDGIIAADGATGQSDLLYTPSDRPGRGPRDVIGIAAGDKCLFAGCANGMVSCVNLDGTARWEKHVGAPVVGAPLTVDINDDRTLDVLVPTREGKVIALDGPTGRTAWVANVARPSPSASLLGTVLSCSDLLPGQGPEVVVTTPLGHVAVLTVRTGRPRWEHEILGGTMSGVVCRGGSLDAGPPAYLADRAARVWGLINSRHTFEPVCWASLGFRPEETLVAGLRTLRTEPEGPPILLACPTGEHGGDLGAVCALAPEGLLWRVPLGGAVWGTPAVADLNGDRNSEIVVATIHGAPDGRLVGGLTVVSHTGHYLVRVSLPAPVECSPAVADVDGDGKLELLVADTAGWLHCFALRLFGPVRWGLYAGDSHNTRNAANAFTFGQAPVRYQWEWQPE